MLGKHPGAKDRQWGIVQEHMDGGSLSKLIQGQMANPHTVLYSDRQALAWCADIAEALAHLHSMDPMIIHRDVKQDNILLKFIDEGRLAAKLLDFGLHVLMDDDRSNRAVYRGIKTGELVDPRVVSADGALPPPLHPSTAGIRRYNAAVGEFVIRGLSCNGSLPQAALSRTTSSSKDYAEVLANGAAAGDGPLSAGAAGNGMADGAWPGFRHVGGAADEPAGCAAPAGMVFVPMVMHGKVQQHSPIGNGEQQGDRPASAGGSSSTGASCAMTIDIPGASGRGGSAGGAAAFGGMPQRSAPLPIIPPARTASPAIPISIPGGVRGGGGVAGGSLQPYMPLVHPDAGGPFIIDGDSDRDEVTPCGSRFASQAGMVGAANGDGMTMGLQSVDGGGVEGGSWHSSGGGHNGHRPPTNQVSRFFNAVIEDAHLLEERFTVMFQLTGQTGSCIYMAPEVYKREPYNEKVDVFSFGVIMYEIFARSLILFTYTPHSSPADADAYAGRVAAGFRPSRPSHLHPAIWDLITRCWQDHPARRPSMAQVLAELRLMMETNADEFGTPKCQCVIS